MKPSDKKPIRTRIGTREESLRFQNQIRKQNARYPQNTDAEAINLPDGHTEATRVQFNRDTGEVIRDKSGDIQVCAPWLLCGVFSLPTK